MVPFETELQQIKDAAGSAGSQWINQQIQTLFNANGINTTAPTPVATPVASPSPIFSYNKYLMLGGAALLGLIIYKKVIRRGRA